MKSPSCLNILELHIYAYRQADRETDTQITQVVSLFCSGLLDTVDLLLVVCSSQWQMTLGRKNFRTWSSQEEVVPALPTCPWHLTPWVAPGKSLTPIYTSSTYKKGIHLTSQAVVVNECLQPSLKMKKLYKQEALGSLAYHCWRGPGRHALTAHNRLTTKNQSTWCYNLYLWTRHTLCFKPFISWGLMSLGTALIVSTWKKKALQMEKSQQSHWATLFKQGSPVIWEHHRCHGAHLVNRVHVHVILRHPEVQY